MVSPFPAKAWKCSNAIMVACLAFSALAAAVAAAYPFNSTMQNALIPGMSVALSLLYICIIYPYDIFAWLVLTHANEKTS